VEEDGCHNEKCSNNRWNTSEKKYQTVSQNQITVNQKETATTGSGSHANNIYYQQSKSMQLVRRQHQQMEDQRTTQV
jgi:hypothetical protein